MVCLHNYIKRRTHRSPAINLTGYLNENLIETRNLFAGNITKQPGYIKQNFRVADNLDNTDYIMNNTFFLGTYPGLTKKMLNYAETILNSFISCNSDDNKEI